MEASTMEGKRHEMLVQRVLTQKHISWKDGGFYLWDVPMIMFPIYDIIDLYKSMVTTHPGAHTIFYAIGEKQAILAIDYIKNKFGFKNSTELLQTVLEQSLLLGYGTWLLKRFDPSKPRATMVNPKPTFAKHFKIVHGQQSAGIDYYFAGTKAGMVEALTDKKAICVETMCAAKGDNQCVLEVFPEEEARGKYPEWCQGINPIDVNTLRLDRYTEKKILKSSQHKESQ